MTSINININNLEEKKEISNINLKLTNLDDYRDEDKNVKAEKKRKIREKAAALLTRVKSQEYMNNRYPGDPCYPTNYGQNKYY
jgi:hypothetical protein